ncbi:MFS transporter [Microbacterium sp. M1A1_1b]
MVARGVPDRDAGRAQTIVNSGTGAGLVAAGVLALVLLPDWRTAWLVSAVCAVLTGAAVLVTDRGARSGPRGNTALPPAAWFRQHGGLLVAALLLGAGSAAVWNLGRAVVVDAGAGGTASVVAWIALGLGGAAVVLTARWLGARPVRTAWAITVLAVALGTVGLGVGAAVVPVAFIACLVFGWGYTAATGVLITWTSSLAPEHAPSGTSMLFVTLVLGQAVGAAAAGGVLDHVGALLTMLVAALVAVAGIPTARVRQNGDP